MEILWLSFTTVFWNYLHIWLYLYNMTTFHLFSDDSLEDGDRKKIYIFLVDFQYITEKEPPARNIIFLNALQKNLKLHLFHEEFHWLMKESWQLLPVPQLFKLISHAYLFT